MTRFRVLWSRLADMVLHRRREDRLSDEVQAHLDLLTDEHIARGMTPAKARLAARKAFGGVDQIKAVYRDQRGLPFIDNLLQDVRYGIRTLIRQPGVRGHGHRGPRAGDWRHHRYLQRGERRRLAAIAFAEPDRIVVVTNLDTKTGARSTTVSSPDFRDWREQSRSFDSLEATGSRGARARKCWA